ncbi:N-acetylglutamate synthase-like GNAT family acetyltransferase [Stackebrandtia albiflava]|uniref:N-acetylglutamate synthase-like GNAT family acetyltransferase n=1 Tax=Stackebrandtia albiflava TaxID=406432 RepID=A0A562V9Y7_9ACTN|nr:GNAT family N-acetyltransferase [Stackebrandtia albiflava]TWJ14700.1 N-acetylglutamate synthase-like GNAT family acetyltransferase [Stackebrandtia albiflava]
MSQNDFTLRLGAAAVDLDWLHDRLSTDTYWAIGRSRERVTALVRNSRCYSVFGPDGRQVGFARLVTDSVTFAWLSDVYVDRTVRGRGVSRILLDRVVADCESLGLRRVLLATDDAEELYRRYGFTPVAEDHYRWMALTWPDHPA